MKLWKCAYKFLLAMLWILIQIRAKIHHHSIFPKSISKLKVLCTYRKLISIAKSEDQKIGQIKHN